jgi:O-antigen/teichoic acid export membrane protein
MLLMSTAPLVVKILLTDSYYPAISLIRWMGAAIFLQSVSYPMGYITFAKGNRRLYFWLEGIFANVVYLATTCLCYRYLGLPGLGLAAILRYAVDVVVYYVVNRRVYGFGYNIGCTRIVIESGVYVAAAFVLTQILGGTTCVIAAIALSLIVGYRSYRLIANRLKADC